jgi:hypothetical protein
VWPEATIIEEKLPYIDTLTLDHGAHAAPNNGLVDACVMEAVAYITGEPWSDHPECASPVIGAFLRSWNDSLDTVQRQMLKPYIVKVVGTNTGTEDDETRAWMVTDWLARECAPAFMRLAGLTGQAELVERLAPIVSSQAAKDAQPALDDARKASAAAGAAAWDAARDAARAAAWDAAWAAAGDAAGAAAGDAAWAAAWAAARAAAWDAARDAAGDAAWDAAGDALAPTVATLQQSALLLLDRMVEVGRVV